MKLLDTLLPLWKRKLHCNACIIMTIALISTFPSHGQCDINIFKRGTSAAGSVSLMPWLSYTSGCDISDDCGKLSELVIWDMDSLDPCDNGLSKPNIDNCNVDVSTHTSSSKIEFIAGINNSNAALAIGKGQSSRFEVSFKPIKGQSGQVVNLNYDVKSITDNDALLCKETSGLMEGTIAEYAVTILSRGKQVYMGLKSVSEIWEQELIDLDFISDGENFYDENEALDLEIIISNFTTTGDAILGLDNLILEGKECVFDDNLAYKWSTGETTERIYSIEKGNYCVTVTDCNGCQAVDCISVN